MPDTKNAPWWLHLAKIGSAVGVGAGVASGVTAFIPPPYNLAVGAIFALAQGVAHYADKGIAEAGQ